MQIFIDQDIKTVSAICATEYTPQYGLDSVHITPEYIEATDGYALIRKAKKSDITGTIPAALCKMVKLEKKTPSISVNVSDEQVEYPDSNKMIDSFKDGDVVASVTLDINRLAELTATIAKLRKGKSAYVNLEIRSRSIPVFITVDDITALLMTARDNA